MRIALLAAMPLILVGCAAAPQATSLDVPPGQYSQAFEAAKQTLRDARFDLARLDAQVGVITTLPRVSSGFATPWIAHGGSFGADTEGLAHYQRRTVRVTFTPATAANAAEAAPSPGAIPAAGSGDSAAVGASSVGLPAPGDDAGQGGADLRAFAGPLRADVRVIVDRVYRPGRRGDATSARLQSFTSDPSLAARGLEPLYSVEFREDSALAARLAADISRSMGQVLNTSVPPSAQGAHEP